MKRNTKILLGLAAAGVVAYLASKNKQNSNLIGKQKFSSPNIMGVPVRVENFGGPDKTCPNGMKYVEFPIIKGFKEHLSDAQGGKCVENSVDISIEDATIHPSPLFI